MDLPVVFVDSGREFGRVDSFLIDNDKGMMLGYVLSGGVSGGAARVVPPSAVSRYGAFAMTVTGDGVVEDVKKDEKLFDIYNNEPQLLGLPVHEFGENGEVQGYIKDVSFKIPSGHLLSVWISNEKGFTSPYVAKIDYRDISGVFKDKVILKENCRLNFRRTGILEHAAEKGGFVPLVIREQDWRRALNDRIAEEAAKIQKRISSRLEEDHQKYFVANEKDRLRGELLETLKSAIDSIFDSRLSDVSQKLQNEFEDAAASFIRKDFLESSLAESRRAMESLGSRVESGLKALADAESRAENSFKEKLNAITAALESKAAASLDEALRKLSEAAERKIDAARKESSMKISEMEERFETKLMKVNASVQEFERSAGASIEKLKETIKAVAGEASISALEQTDQIMESLEGLKSRVNELASAPPPVIPDVSNLSPRSELAALESKIRDLIATSSREASERIEELAGAEAGMEKRVSEIKAEFENGMVRLTDIVTSEVERRLSEIDGELSSMSAGVSREIESGTAAFVTKDELEQKISGLSQNEKPSEINTEDIDRRIEELSKKIEASEIPSTIVNKIRQIEMDIEKRVMKEDFDSVLSAVNALKGAALPSSTEDSGEKIVELEKKIADLVSFDQLKTALHTAIGGTSISDVRLEMLNRLDDLKNRIPTASQGAGQELSPDVMERISGEIATLAERALEHADEHIKEMTERLDAAISVLYPKDEIEALITNAVAAAEKRIIESLGKE